jgi:uncharacterized protein YjbI with pentapeptide repeats
MPKKRISRRVKDAGILSSIGMVLITLLVAAAGLWIVFTRLLRDAWPWQEGGLETANRTPAFQTTQLVLTLVGGIGAAILVVVAYRRQRDLELARFDERFAAAAAQLGAGTAAERLAGVYAMAALADTWEIHRQQCIDVLCGYLRLPYDPSSGLLKTVVSEHTWSVGGGGTGKEIRTYEQLPNDREVRLTIISVITTHLREGASVSWQGHDLDFTGATFDGGDFTGAVFSGWVNFGGARFTGDDISFLGTRFSSGIVYFGGAEFSASFIIFTEAAFDGALVNFGSARFSGGTVTFGQRARFSSGDVIFSHAEFCGSEVDFQSTEFSGSDLTFNNAEFTAGVVDFTKAEFLAGGIDLTRSKFAGGRAVRGGRDFRGWNQYSGELWSDTPSPDSGAAVSPSE